MSRLPRSGELLKLSRLTRARELAALQHLAKLSFKVKQAEESVQELRSKSFSATSPADTAVLLKWRLWKEEELKRRNLIKARLMADYATEAKKCGRAIAEHSVLSELLMKAKKSEKERLTKRD
jgi:hypothetical protein